MAFEVIKINGVTKEEYKGNYYYTFNSYISIVAEPSSNSYTISDRHEKRRVLFDDITNKLGATNIEEYVDAMATAGYYRNNIS